MTVFTKFLQPPFPTVLISSFFVDFFALFSPFSRYHRKICITIGSKSKVESILIERGAKIQKSVTSKTNILLVGDEGSSAWIAGNYGTKVKKAMSLQEKGIPVTILRESDYFIK